jgi:hypothetical protein
MATKSKDLLDARPETRRRSRKSKQSARTKPKEKVAITQPKSMYDLPTPIYLRLSYLFGNNDGLVMAWLDAPHAELGGRSPGSFLKEGKLQVIDSLIEAAESGYLG